MGARRHVARNVAGGLASGLVWAALLAGCSDGGAGAGESAADKTVARKLTASIVQLRRDQVLGRVQVAVRNRSGEEIVVERLRLTTPGYAERPSVAKNSPIAAGREVYLPWEYGDVGCRGGTVQVGRPAVELRVRTAGGSTVVRLAARDPEAYLERIAERTCTLERYAREVSLRFGDEWTPEQTSGGVRLHGTLLAELRIDEPREISQVAGAIMYGLLPDESAGPLSEPLARLTPESRVAEIPVEAYAARCDAHTKGEIKKPYEFLVWVGKPGEEPFAISPDVGQPTKDALRLACAF